MKFKFLTLILPIVFIRHHGDNVQKHLNIYLLMRRQNFMMIQHPTMSSWLVGEFSVSQM
jgi:hypothetical protein